ncbi:MAG: DNA polymerase III subunit delta' [Betaproteobacteria bacterium]|nr:DNA polymerase III subunit delta' [Betaproteobacteria bacterium]
MSALPWHREALARLAGRRERLPHALLVSGRAGIGKAAFAREFARSLLCESPQEGLACGACASCNWFSQGNHPDYREVLPEAAEEGDDDAPAEASKEKKSLVIKIGQIRALGDLVSLSTHRAGFRVIVIRPAEALQPAAANALLKTLEEPPPATVIVLVSDRPARLLATIRSRCQVVALGGPPRDVAIAWLGAEGAGEPDVSSRSPVVRRSWHATWLPPRSANGAAAWWASCPGPTVRTPSRSRPASTVRNSTAP